MKKYLILTTAIVIASLFYLGSAIADRDATPEERAQVVEALNEIGCTEVGEVELDGKYFEAEDVVCEGDSKKYEIHLDQDMNIVKKIDDD